MAQTYDYTELESLLSQSEWKEADRVTAKLICAMAQDSYTPFTRYDIENYNSSYLSEKSIRAIPIKELKKIDSLWQKYSDGKFGFTPQVKIWLKHGAPLNLSPENILINKKSANQLMAEDFYSSLDWYSRDSSNYPTGAFPFAYGLITVGSDGFLDFRYMLFGKIILIVGFFMGLSIASTMTDMKFLAFIITFVVSGSLVMFMCISGLNNQIHFKSQSWLVVLSRFSK